MHPPAQPEAFDETDTCPNHLNALVIYLEETAQIEGRTLVVDWREDGTVMLYYDDFAQHMWCEDGTLQVHCGGPVPKRPEK